MAVAHTLVMCVAGLVASANAKHFNSLKDILGDDFEEEEDVSTEITQEEVPKEGKADLTMQSSETVLERRHANNGDFLAREEPTLPPVLATPPLPTEPPCPSTYVYDLPEELMHYSGEGKALTTVFGSEMKAKGWTVGLYNSREASLVETWLYRLRIGKRCRQESRPNYAELFLVPILPGADAGAWEMHCHTLVTTDWKVMLPHVSARTARRHVVVMPQPDEQGRLPCSRFWRNLPLVLREAIKITTDLPTDPNQLNTMPEHMFLVPKPTGVHWSRQYEAAQVPHPWAVASKARPIFASFFGGVHGPDRWKKLRDHVRNTCEKENKCEMIVRKDGPATEELRNEMPHMMRSKKLSTFCLEPPGTTFARQSLVQSMLSGCIPVLFDKKQDTLFPWHWGSWRKGSRVLLEVPDACFQQGDQVNEDPPEECDIIAQLKTISQKTIVSMQRRLAKHAHQLQYALTDHTGDALETIMNSLHEAAPPMPPLHESEALLSHAQQMSESETEEYL